MRPTGHPRSALRDVYGSAPRPARLRLTRHLALAITAAFLSSSGGPSAAAEEADTAAGIAARPRLAEALAQGDHAWDRRAETVEERLAEPGRIREAIARYRAAHEAEPEALVARWKLLRALHYAIDFTTLAEDEKDAHAEQAIELARDSVEKLDAQPPADDAQGASADRARVLFWSAIAWGSRAQRVGLLTLVREGIARRMHDLAERSLALDPSVDRGGALRLLSRLHATLPRVPFVSGWVDRDEALPLAERAHANDPAHPGNRLILALALLEQAPDREREARDLLASVAAAEPRASHRVEDLAIREQARERLEALGGPDPDAS